MAERSRSPTFNSQLFPLPLRPILQTTPEKENMKVLRFYILYRLPIIAALIIIGVLFHINKDVVTAWLCYIAAAISLTLYFMMGTMRLVQDAVTKGDMDQAIKYLNQIKFPQLLFKPIRAGYYTLQSNLSMVNNDFASAEANIRKSMQVKSSIAGDQTGTNLMQLGFIEIRKGNAKQARLHLMDAIKAGIPDKDNLAATYLQLCSIEAQRQQYRIAKQYFKKAKDLKSENEDVLIQIKQLEKQIKTLPG